MGLLRASYATWEKRKRIQIKRDLDRCKLLIDSHSQPPCRVDLLTP